MNKIPSIPGAISMPVEMREEEEIVVDEAPPQRPLPRTRVSTEAIQRLERTLTLSSMQAHIQPTSPRQMKASSLPPSEKTPSLIKKMITLSQPPVQIVDKEIHDIYTELSKLSYQGKTHLLPEESVRELFNTLRAMPHEKIPQANLKKLHGLFSKDGGLSKNYPTLRIEIYTLQLLLENELRSKEKESTEGRPRALSLQRSLPGGRLDAQSMKNLYKTHLFSPHAHEICQELQKLADDPFVNDKTTEKTKLFLRDLHGITPERIALVDLETLITLLSDTSPLSEKYPLLRVQIYSLNFLFTSERTTRRNHSSSLKERLASIPNLPQATQKATTIQCMRDMQTIFETHALSDPEEIDALCKEVEKISISDIHDMEKIEILSFQQLEKQLYTLAYDESKKTILSKIDLVRPLQFLEISLPKNDLKFSPKVQAIIHEISDTEAHYQKDLLFILETFEKYETMLKEKKPHQFHEFHELFTKPIQQLIHAIPNMHLALPHEQATTFPITNVIERPLPINITSAYTEYSNNFDKCAQYLQKLDEKNLHKKNVAVQDLLKPKNLHQLTLEDYLIKPVQRILKYSLLLKELMKIERGTLDFHILSRYFPALEQNYQCWLAITDCINLSKRCTIYKNTLETL